MRGIVLVPRTEHLEELRERHGGDSAGGAMNTGCGLRQFIPAMNTRLSDISTNSLLFKISNEIFKENLKKSQKTPCFLFALDAKYIRRAALP